MSVPVLKCVICGDEVIRKHHSQTTCLKDECRKKAHNKWNKKGLVYTKDCRSCGVQFKTTSSQKVYCSKECSEKIRKIRTKMNSADWYRRKKGTYEKWIRILREMGYTVIEPRRKK